MRRREATDGGVPPAHLMSLPVWIADGRSPDPGPAPAWWAAREANEGVPWQVHQARIDWERARREWVRGAPALDVLNSLFGPGLDAGPEVDPRVAEYERRTAEAVLGLRGQSP